MIRTALAAVLAIGLAQPAVAQISADTYVASLTEMYRLVEPGESRSLLFCIEIAGKVGMQDARVSFLSQMGRHTQDGQALMLSLAYVSGAFEEDWKAINEGPSSTEVLAALFQEQCMPLLLR